MRTSIRACPICGKPAVQAAWPFCSPRCADIDLHRWLSGAYSVPTVPADEDGEPSKD
ncbi:MAG: DNA gyrase inhibitor YacG [Beijerinckiaceae bacterium]